VVMRSESQWYASLRSPLKWSDTEMATRYFDNRLILRLFKDARPAGNCREMHALLSDSFYPKPILLEPEGSDQFVGLRIVFSGVSIRGVFKVDGFNELTMHNDVVVMPREHRWRYRCG
jgi:hypothetical protein